jgi:hypothetical protein
MYANPKTNLRAYEGSSTVQYDRYRGIHLLVKETLPSGLCLPTERNPVIFCQCCCFSLLYCVSSYVTKSLHGCLLPGRNPFFLVVSYCTEAFFSRLSPSAWKSPFPARKFFLPIFLVLHGNPLFESVSYRRENFSFPGCLLLHGNPFYKIIFFSCRETLFNWLSLSTERKSCSSSMNVSSSTQRIASLHMGSGMTLIDLLRLRLEQYY